VALLQQGKVAEAVPCFQQAAILKPDHAEAHSNLGVALLQQRKFKEAQASLQQAVRLKPDIAELHANLGMALAEQGQFEGAEACYRQAVRLKPDYPGAYSELGVALADQGRLTEAVACYQQALRLKPSYAEVHMNLAYARLVRGDLEAAWPDYEWRWKCRDAAPPPFQQPLWDGSSLQGRTILLFAEQGLGDTLHFIRYAPLVKRTGGTVIVQCQGTLLRLLGTCAGIDNLVAESTDPPHCDVQAPLLSLPRIFRTTLSTVPARIPYLSADSELRARWGEPLRGIPELKVGISWRGSAEHKRDRQRSVPLLAFAPLEGVPGVRLVSLQKGPGREQLSDQSECLHVLDMADQLEDFADTAALMSNLDLVITVDTAVAHLAGALGIPVWVALPLVPDWRWLLEREDSPWYPSMRLFRQTAWGDWTAVFERLTEALRHQVAARGE
jgi:lipoprotein NlpI